MSQDENDAAFNAEQAFDKACEIAGVDPANATKEQRTSMFELMKSLMGLGQQK